VADTNKASRNPLWAALAVLDALILACVIMRFPWGHNVPASGSSMFGELLVYLAYGLDILLNLAAAAFAAAVAYAIARDILGPWRPPWWAALMATLPLLGGLALSAFIGYVALHEVLVSKGAGMTMADRLVVFDQLATRERSGDSVGAQAAWLALAAYLGEKYLLRWWGLRWPLPVVGIALLGWPAWIALRGEADQDKWMRAQQFKVLGENLTWTEALSGCRALGNEWRLMRRNELALYLALEPEPARKFTGHAWTMTVSDLGRAVVVMDLKQRRSGYYRHNEVPWHDRSLCENDVQARPPDWFVNLRPHLCGPATSYEGQFIATLQPPAVITGRRETATGREYITAQTKAAAFCIKPAGPELPLFRRRAYPREEDFLDPDAFVARLKEACSARGLGDVAACTAFATYGADTNASAGWVTK